MKVPQRRRKHLYHPDEIKEKIGKSQILNRLIKFVNGEIEMAPHQVTAALGLLRKAIPDLSAAEIKHDATQSYIDAIRAASTERHRTDHSKVEEKPAELRH